MAEEQPIDHELTEHAAGSSTPLHPWQVLVVDDAAVIHELTAFLLARLLIDGRPLQLLHAYSAAEAQALLQAHPTIAVILLDVMMETEDAGLQLVKVIRHELGLKAVRIILLTGKPSLAPELETMRDYDINDYKVKTSLNRARLITMLTAALRAYQQLTTLSQNAQWSQTLSLPDRLTDAEIATVQRGKFRKKPIVVDAYQTPKRLAIHTLEGVLIAEPGDWIITGTKGEQYPCKPDIFEKTYEFVNIEGG
jgi:CheY-like chemotaxis protein